MIHTVKQELTMVVTGYLVEIRVYTASSICATFQINATERIAGVAKP
jgi:hypothetical protein